MEKLQQLVKTFPVTVALSVGSGLILYWFFDSFWLLLLGLVVGGFIGFRLETKHNKHE